MEQRNLILIVDATEATRTHLSRILKENYMVLEAEDGLSGYHMIQKNRGVLSAILLEIPLPGLDGFQIMEMMQKEDMIDSIPVVLIVPDAFREDEVKGMELGASDVIMEPFPPAAVKKRVENVIRLSRYRRHMEEMVKKQTKKITENSRQLVDALSTVVEYRNMESGLHIRRIRSYTKTLLRVVAHRFPEYHLTQQTIATIANASAMHDIGKIAIPDKILLKPGRLTPSEFEIMKGHTLKGCSILEAFHRMEDKEYLEYCYEICRYHHERWDGRGYPDGLSGGQIPLCAQVVAIADVYDALTSDRVYKPAYSHEKAAQMILNGECGTFSDQMLTCFQEACARFRELSERYADETVSMGQEAFPEIDELGQNEVIAKLHEASTALQREMLQRDALINAIPGGVAKVALDDEFTILFASYGFYRMTGYSRTEFHEGVIDGKCMRLFPPEDMLILSEGFRDQARDSQRISLELRLLRKDGSIVWVDLHGSIVEKENGVDVMQAVFIDTTVAKEMEQKLLELMNSVPGGIAQIQVDNGVHALYVSDGFFHMTDYSRSDFYEVHPDGDIMRLIHPDDVDMVRERVTRVVASGEKQITVEYRVICRDGSIRWHQASGARTDENTLSFRCVFTDVTESKEVQEQLRINEERFRIIVEQVQDVIFEWDIQNDKMYFSPAFQRKFGYEMPKTDFRKCIMQSDIVFEEDKNKLNKHFFLVDGGVTQDETEVRIRNREGTFIWCKIRVTVLSDDNGKALRTMGVLSDVDAYKRENALLEARSQRDLLTDLLNKTTFQSLMDDYLRNVGRNGRHAFFILDVDNFKEINSRIGHMQGDSVLCEITKELRDKFRGDDLIGRTGGDEFVVLLKNTPSQEIAEKKAELIRELFRTISERQVKKGQPEVSGSVGVTIFPRDGATFQELFQRADQALYLSKHSGKSCVTFYTK